MMLVSRWERFFGSVVSFCRSYRNAVSDRAYFLICLPHTNKDGALSGSFLELERARDLRGLRLRGGAVVRCVLGSKINDCLQRLRAPERSTSPVLAFLGAARVTFGVI